MMPDANHQGEGSKAAGRNDASGDGNQRAGHDGRKDAIVLKYLELARTELLERIKFGYQTLIVYAGGVGAVAAWAYPSQQTSSSNDLHTFAANSRLEPVSVIIAFLAAVTTWIIHHNEYMVNALARYQVDSLSAYLMTVLPEARPWELSAELQVDTPKYVFRDLWTQGSLVVLPAFLGCLLQLIVVLNSCISPIWLVVASGLTAVAFVLSQATVRGRQQLRREMEAKMRLLPPATSALPR